MNKNNTLIFIISGLFAFFLFCFYYTSKAIAMCFACAPSVSCIAWQEYTRPCLLLPGQTGSQCCNFNFAPTPTPMPQSQPPPGAVITLPPGQPSPTPPPQGGNTCQANCSGQVCGTVAGSYDCRVRGCGDGNCDSNDGLCKKCTNPGKSCCNYCVPEGWGCGGSSCPWEISCRSFNKGNGLMGCGPDTTSGCSGGNVCPNQSCEDPWCQTGHTCGDCYLNCPTEPTPTPIPPCSISNFSATKNNSSCGASTVNLGWTVNSPIETSYVIAQYNDGSNWLQSNFNPANPLSNTATQTTSPLLNPGGYNFIVSCNKNNTNYGYPDQIGVLIEVCPTATPIPTATPTPTPTPIPPTPTPISIKASCTGGGIAPQPAIDGKSVTYTKGTTTAGWNWGIKYQYNALVPDQNTLCVNNPDTTCTLTANLSSGRDLYFGTNLSKTIDGTTYYCRFDGTWIPNAPNNNPETITGCTNACSYAVNIITPTPTNAPPSCGTISYTGDDSAGNTVPVTAPGTDPNLNQTLTYNWTKNCGTLASSQTQVAAVRSQTNSPSSVNFTCPADGERCIVNTTVGDGVATSNCTGVQVCGCGAIPIPSLNSPANNYCTSNPSFTLSASGVSTDYQFAIDDENTFSTPWLFNSGWGGGSVPLSLTSGTYYWTARTTINQDVCDGNFASPRKLMIDTNPLSKVTDRSIECLYDGATDSYKVQYSWDTINYTGLCGFDNYLAQVWSDTTHQNYYFDTTTNTNSPWTTVPANITISAHTKAYDKATPVANESGWSNGTNLIINYGNCGRDIPPAPTGACGQYSSGATPITWTWTSSATGLQVKDTYSFASGGGTADNWKYNAAANSGKIINGIAPGTTVYGRVTNDFVTFSTENSVTCPTPTPTNAPPTPTVTPTPGPPVLSCVVSDTTISWSWTASTPPSTDGNYFLQVGTGSADSGNKFNAWTPGLAKDTTNLVRNTTYYAHVTGTGGAPWSTEVSCKTDPPGGTYLLGRFWWDKNEDFRRDTSEPLLTNINGFTDVNVSVSYNCGGGWSGSASNPEVNVCEHENGMWNPGVGPYMSSYILKTAASSCSLTASVNTPDWYFIPPKTNADPPVALGDAGGWLVFGDTMCPLPTYPCNCSFAGWGGNGSILTTSRGYPTTCNRLVNGKCVDLTISGIDASSPIGFTNIWFPINSAPTPTGTITPTPTPSPSSTPTPTIPTTPTPTLPPPIIPTPEYCEY